MKKEIINTITAEFFVVFGILPVSPLSVSVTASGYFKRPCGAGDVKPEALQDAERARCEAAGSAAKVWTYFYLLVGFRHTFF